MSNKTFCPHGMPPLLCLKCQQQRAEPTPQAPSWNKASPLLAQVPVTQARPQQAQAAAGSGFDITQIPAVMDKLGAVQGPRFMRRWFNGPAFELPMDFKTGRKDARLLDKAHRLEDLPFEWLEKSKRVGPTVKSVVEELSDVYEFNGRVGRLKNALDQLSPGLIVLMERLEALGLLHAKQGRLKDGSRSFGDLSALDLDYTAQFNRVDVGTSFVEKAFDDLDDVYFALGSFSLKLAATQLRTYSDHHGYPAIEISELGLYVRDTYDFLNKKGEDQLLGYWNDSGVKKPDPVEYFSEPKSITRAGKSYFKVTNGSFNEHRRRTGKGGDFLAFSTVKHVPVSILVHLGSIDFDEYLGRKSK
ncbi:DUF6402 family protein [Archangium gephyra]|uniref:DUF6402 family protein n=1 Tax=Archangium gephyra TaxID=48 RepID=UPI0035D52501